MMRTLLILTILAWSGNFLLADELCTDFIGSFQNGVLDGDKGATSYKKDRDKRGIMSIEILEVYPGEKWADTCIAEIQFLNENEK